MQSSCSGLIGTGFLLSSHLQTRTMGDSCQNSVSNITHLGDTRECRPSPSFQDDTFPLMYTLAHDWSIDPGISS
ncbi:hypothetical protein PISMIDRAFT_602087 [Pisolithus microcarpus 441]|uniref:Uncharacterized protein n=1 Tax=Pisolithus microcarpus 441 TaxID=765257 RepID=A0A0C9ZJI9_9AGAM|nr:hypothetical protein PISMIDRAFT_602087 [Pisolithus microcarpus 441]